ADVIRAVLARSGTDTSATAARAAEAAAVANPTRLAAEGAAVLEDRREDRYTTILRAAGATYAAIDQAKNTDTWRLLVARMHHAERLGIELDRVANRTNVGHQG